MEQEAEALKTPAKEKRKIKFDDLVDQEKDLADHLVAELVEEQALMSESKLDAYGSAVTKIQARYRGN
jgi:hypothetical protein